MSFVRPPAVAGMFYPGARGELGSMIEGFLDAVPVAPDPVPKAIIAPHAGYVYSGSVAAAAYARLRPARDRIHRVVLLGPCHRVPVRGLAASGAEAFSTPLGDVEVDREAIEEILPLPQVDIFDATHEQEHSLEVHLPFLQTVLTDFKVVPLIVGDATPDEVAEVLETLWGGEETLIVISSDLSHYLDYDSARAIDSATCKAIEALDPGAIRTEQACGRVPVRGLLALARRRGLKVDTLDLRNSGDTAGPRDRVVGYGAWAFTETGSGGGESEPDEAAGEPGSHGARIVRIRCIDKPAKPAVAPAGTAADGFEAATRDLLRRHGPLLLKVAASSIEHGMRAGMPITADPSDFPDATRRTGACFVTLKKSGHLRGCIGTPEAHRPLIVDVAENAFRAAFRDPRFPPLQRTEAEDLSMSVSVLSPAAPITFTDEKHLLDQLRPGTDGLIIEDGARRALFLPSVWEQIPDRRMFLQHLKTKAGLAADHWSDSFRAWRFVAGEAAQADLPEPAAIWSWHAA